MELGDGIKYRDMHLDEWCNSTDEIFCSVNFNNNEFSLRGGVIG